jgi:hypothetical protein
MRWTRGLSRRSRACGSGAPTEQYHSLLTKIVILTVHVAFAGVTGVPFCFPSGMGVVTRVMDLIFAAIAVDMLAEGLKTLLPGLAWAAALPRTAHVRFASPSTCKAEKRPVVGLVLERRRTKHFALPRIGSTARTSIWCAAPGAPMSWEEIRKESRRKSYQLLRQSRTGFHQC